MAGAGTGDATIFLAEQLRAVASDAGVVHPDRSEASIAIARQRAQIRGLTHISWVHDSLLTLPQLAHTLGRFGYIHCSGVPHHLAEPDLGPKALLSVLKDDGALGLMVYASTGRTGVIKCSDCCAWSTTADGYAAQDCQRARPAGRPAANQRVQAQRRPAP